jgi:hypothetical protein
MNNPVITHLHISAIFAGTIMFSSVPITAQQSPEPTSRTITISTGRPSVSSLPPAQLVGALPTSPPTRPSAGSPPPAQPVGALPTPTPTPQIVTSYSRRGAEPYASVNVVPPSVAMPANPYYGASKADIDRQVMRAIEEVLMRFGNPPYAEIVTNDPVKAEELRYRLNAVQSGSKIKSEIDGLEARKSVLIAEVQQRENETARMRMDIARLHRVLTNTLNELSRTQRMIEDGGYNLPVATSTGGSFDGNNPSNAAKVEKKPRSAWPKKK